MAAAAAGIGSRRQKSDGDKYEGHRGSGESEQVNKNCESFGRYTPEFFKMGTNLSGITWAHAVNSKMLLNKALQGTRTLAHLLTRRSSESATSNFDVL